MQSRNGIEAWETVSPPGFVPKKKESVTLDQLRFAGTNVGF
ncbi:hypothetical protein RESH_03387 [Rhodopirellula europaea SH398]|uniref:Uncharacterized protein n=1 Tax=Rhodopirellula europaea SH398 TaxID=1263868 RepID=M5S3E4_9BACT|nr:hypothetical protein RESH_03387 [Rhodopirellula europaea SH398]